jgi:hypothetical protein
MQEKIDASLYTSEQLFDTPGGIALATMLIQAAPKQLSPDMKRGLGAVKRSAMALKKAWELSDQSQGGVDTRAADNRLDQAWAGVKSRLDAYARLPAGEYARAPRAAALVELLFPNGMGFLNLSYTAEWAESQRILERIVKQELQKDVDLLAGREFLAEAKAAHALYGQVLGTTKAKKVKNTVSLAEPLKQLRADIVDYTLTVVVFGNAKTSQLGAARAALAPLDELRANQASHRAAAEKARTSPAEPAPVGSKAAPTPTAPPRG